MLIRARRFVLFAIIALAASHSLLGETPPSNTPGDKASVDNSIPKADILRVSEAFGHFIGRNLNSPGIEFDLEGIIKGMRAGAAGQPAPMSDKEYEEMMARLQEKALKALSETNLTKANAFLTENAKSKGIVEIQPNKLQYLILQEGKGEAVIPHSSPKINYTGKYIDGTVFGSSEDTSGPIVVPLDQTIPGFSEGIVGMKEGEKRRLFVHPDLGYGTSGHLPPNALLIFDIELIKANTHDEDSADQDDNDEDDLPPLALANEGEEQPSKNK